MNCVCTSMCACVCVCPGGQGCSKSSTLALALRNAHTPHTHTSSLDGSIEGAADKMAGISGGLHISDTFGVGGVKEGREGRVH